MPEQHLDSSEVGACEVRPSGLDRSIQNVILYQFNRMRIDGSSPGRRDDPAAFDRPRRRDAETARASRDAWAGPLSTFKGTS